MQCIETKTTFVFLPCFIHVQPVCMRVANALMRLRVCASSPEPWLLADAVSTTHLQSHGLSY